MRALIVTLLAIAIGVAADWQADLIRPLFDQDTTHITYVIAGLTAALGTTYRTKWTPWTVKHGVLLMFGLLGTVVGFMMALSGVTAGVDLTKMTGVTTALTTTIVGIVCHLYLLVLVRVQKMDDRALDRYGERYRASLR